MKETSVRLGSTYLHIETGIEIIHTVGPRLSGRGFFVQRRRRSKLDINRLLSCINSNTSLFYLKLLSTKQPRNH
jgi:hypothetical protein